MDARFFLCSGGGYFPRQASRPAAPAFFNRLRRFMVLLSARPPTACANMHPVDRFGSLDDRACIGVQNYAGLHGFQFVQHHGGGPSFSAGGLRRSGRQPSCRERSLSRCHGKRGQADSAGPSRPRPAAGLAEDFQVLHSKTGWVILRAAKNPEWRGGMATRRRQASSSTFLNWPWAWERRCSATARPRWNLCIATAVFTGPACCSRTVASSLLFTFTGMF